MSGHGQKMTRKQERAISDLLSCPTIPDAALSCNISEWSLYQWLKLPEFCDAYVPKVEQIYRPLRKRGARCKRSKLNG